MAFSTDGISISMIIDLSLVTKNILASGNIATRSDLDSLTATVNGKAAQADLDALTVTVNGKAAQADLDALTVVVNSKAAQADLAALTITVGSKAAQADLDTVAGRVTSLETPKAYSTAMRPDASTFLPGTRIYDTDLTKPFWSDGNNWRDATGSL